MNFPVIIPPSGLLESCHEVLMEPVDGGQLVIVVLTSGFRELADEERHGLYNVPDVGAAGGKKRFLGGVGEVAGPCVCGGGFGYWYHRVVR